MLSLRSTKRSPKTTQDRRFELIDLEYSKPWTEERARADLEGLEAELSDEDFANER